MSKKYVDLDGLAYFLGKLRTAFAAASHTHAATSVSITDNGGYFTAENTEGALQELGSAVDGIETLLAEI